MTQTTFKPNATVKHVLQELTNLFLEEVLSVLEGAELELLVLVLQLLLGGAEVEEEVLQGEHHGVHGQR